MATKAQEIATTIDAPPTYAIARMDPRELAEAIALNMEGERLSPFDLDRVKVPAGGATTWEVPSLDGPQDVKSLDGIIIAQRSVRSYWSAEFSGSGTPPECASQDGKVGIGIPGGDCDACPLAAFGSGRNNRAQACKLNRLLFVLREDAVLPLVVPVPPSSLGAVKRYLLALTTNLLPFYAVVTRLDLARTKNADGIQYGEIVPSRVRNLSADELTRVKAAHALLAPLLAAVRLDAEA